MERRTFLRTSCALGGAGLAGVAAFLESCSKTDVSPQGPTIDFTLDLSLPANAALNSAGGSLATSGVVIANTGSEIVAEAESCTHQGCSIGYSSSGQNFVCPCHGGTYDMSGNVTGGPPPAPLKKYAVTLSGTSLHVAG